MLRNSTMTKNNQFLLRELMESGMDRRLKEMKKEFLQVLPIELIHIEDREVCEAIDAYFEAKEKGDPITFDFLGELAG